MTSFLIFSSNLKILGKLLTYSNPIVAILVIFYIYINILKNYKNIKLLIYFNLFISF